MSRKEEFEKVKELIKSNVGFACCGIFFSRNTAGDKMDSIFVGRYYRLQICYSWEYFELFGATEKEQKEIESLYENCEGTMTINKLKEMLND